MKTLDEVIKVFTKCFDNTYNVVPLECEPEYGEDALHYLKQYKADLDKKCSNCKNWHGHKNYDSNDPWREEYYCSHETWTYPDDTCSRWEKML